MHFINVMMPWECD